MPNAAITNDCDIQSKLRREIAAINLRRFRTFAIAAISIEVTIIAVLLLNYSVNPRFKAGTYLFMYLLMILVTLISWWVLTALKRKLDQKADVTSAIEIVLLSFVTFIMVWGAVVACLDQALYHNITVFLVNMLIGSIVFFIKGRHVIIAQLTATAVLLIGLPFYEASTNVLIGHIVNVIIFTILAWVVARANYTAVLNNIVNQRIIEDHAAMLAAVNEHLLTEIQSHEKAKIQLEAANEQLKVISTLDALTGIPNRRQMDVSIEAIWRKAREMNSSISVLMIDIDLFKLYNDSYGHLAGDICLRDVAAVLTACRIGVDDMLVRYGGEEFLYVAAGLEMDQAVAVGERIRAGIEALGIEHSDSYISPVVTVSVGVSWCQPRAEDTPIMCIERADQAMYQAKGAGRNQVVVA